MRVGKHSPLSAAGVLALYAISFISLICFYTSFFFVAMHFIIKVADALLILLQILFVRYINIL